MTKGFLAPSESSVASGKGATDDETQAVGPGGRAVHAAPNGLNRIAVLRAASANNEICSVGGGRKR